MERAERISDYSKAIIKIAGLTTGARYIEIGHEDEMFKIALYDKNKKLLYKKRIGYQIIDAAIENELSKQHSEGINKEALRQAATEQVINRMVLSEILEAQLQLSGING